MADDDLPRQRIRPGLAELRSLPPELNFDEEDEEDVPTYAPAATVRRGAPPEIGSSDQVQSSQSRDKGEEKSRPGQVRFDVDFGTEGNDDDPSPAGPSIAALVGSIQERRPAQTNDGDGRKAPRIGQSRFAVQRLLDRDAGIASISSHRGAEGSQSQVKLTHTSDSDEQWLDEDGHPMSAFRKKQLIKKGLKPPSVRPINQSTAPGKGVLFEKQYESDDTRSMMQSISAENDAKIASMSADEVEEDLKELQETFGVRLLEMFKQRREGQRSDEQGNEGITTRVEVATSAASGKDRLQSMNASEIRDKYFPDEAKELPASLEWTQDMEKVEDGAQTALRYDFDGALLSENSSADAKTLAAGLHNHGEQQDRPGYTTAELLHLARSTLPGQRVMALQTLSRIISRYADTSSVPHVAASLTQANVPGQACFIASWYIEDRQNNVRSTALTCIVTCLASQDRFESLTESADELTTDVEGSKRGPTLTDPRIREGLLYSLLRLFDLPDASPSELTAAVRSLIILTKNSREMCAKLAQLSDPLSRLSLRCITSQPWPVRDNQVKSSLFALELLTILIAGHRSSAVSLYENGTVNYVLRFLSIQPWTVADVSVRRPVWMHFRQALRLLTFLGRYGVASDLYGRSHAIFVRLQGWMVRSGLDSMDDDEQLAALDVLTQAFDLYTVWVVCATDAHQTHNHHDITFSQVSEWQEIALEGLSALEDLKVNDVNVVQICSARSAAIRLLSAWRTCAERNTKKIPEQTAEQSALLSRAAGSVVSLCSASLQKLEGEFSISVKGGAVLASCCEVALRYTEEGDDQSRASTIFDQLVLQLANSLQCMTGDVGSQRQLAESLYGVLKNSRGPWIKTQQWISVACALPAGSEVIARQILLERLPGYLDEEGQKAIATLLPFINELTRPRKVIPGAPLRPTPTTIKETDTLFSVIVKHGDASDDIDPLSSAELWWSANSGLPLRKDWPLVALDDLMHSGTCAALNRPNVLPKEWDANESQIVEASLALAVKLWNSDDPSCPPSPAEIQMAIMKVFLLEEEQMESTRASGRITGRDIYRSGPVASLIAQLFSLADRLPDPTHDTLEAVSQRQFGRAVPFYQLYTSLVGLYDGISFGFELFARALLVPLQMSNAPDYRRLLWSDYAHCLATITTSIHDAPGGLQAYVNGVEKDETVIRAMTVALLSNYVDKQRTEMLYAVAIHHLGAIIWQQDDHLRSKHLIKALFGDELWQNASVTSHLTVMRHSLVHWTGAGELEPGQGTIGERVERIQQAFF